MYNLIVKRGRKWPTLPVAGRIDTRDSMLYAFGSIPVMSDRGEDYVFSLQIHTFNPESEKQLASLCSRAINGMPDVIKTMQHALAKLDSVAFLSVEGDTDEVKQRLRTTLDGLTGPT